VPALVALVGSYTRTAWLAFAFGLLIAAAVRNRSLFLLAPLLVVAVTLAAPSTTARFNDLGNSRTGFGGPGNSLRARYDLWRTNVPKVARNPIIGEGLKGIQEEEAVHVHSDYLRTAVETGLPGLAAYLWLLLATIRGCSRTVRRTAALGRMPRAVAVGAFATSVAFVLASADSNLLTQVAVAGTFWAIAAAGHAAGRLALPGGHESPTAS
jgi:O-antigen ligase